jgi:hypothetical protein
MSPITKTSLLLGAVGEIFGCVVIVTYCGIAAFIAAWVVGILAWTTLDSSFAGVIGAALAIVFWGVLAFRAVRTVLRQTPTIQTTRPDPDMHPTQESTLGCD